MKIFNYNVNLNGLKVLKTDVDQRLFFQDGQNRKSIDIADLTMENRKVNEIKILISSSDSWIKDNKQLFRDSKLNEILK